MRLPQLGLCFALPGVAGAVLGASLEERVEVLFRPPLGEMIALSPDGQRVAYTQRDGGRLKIVLLDVEPPGPKRVVKIDPERDPAGREAPVATQLRFLRWAPNGRLVYAPVERVAPLPPMVDQNGRTTPNPDGPAILAPILAVDADGRFRGALVDAKDFQETPAGARRSLADFLRTPKEMAAARPEAVHWRMPHLDILGFHPRDRDQLIIRTHGAYSMPMQHLVDLRTGSVREFGGEWPAPPGEPQVFDWHRLKVVGERKDGLHPTTDWRDDELASVQRELEAKFPRRVVEMLDWSEPRVRVLARVTGGSDPGRFFVYQRTENVVVEILRCAPWLAPETLHATRALAGNAADGARLSGYVTWPTKPRAQPPPLVVVFPRGFPGWGQPAFDPEAQVLADFGFVVLRLNHRSAGGIRAEDQGALRTAADRVTVEDAHAALEALARNFPERAFDRRQVVAFGHGFGGYLAVRALQLQPAVYRCGIALDAPMDLRGWLRTPGLRDVPVALFDPATGESPGRSVLEQADTLVRPILLGAEPGGNAAVEAASEALRARLHALGRAPETLVLGAGFGAAEIEARVAAYRRVEEFLQAHAAGFVVQVGAAKEVQ